MPPLESIKLSRTAPCDNGELFFLAVMGLDVGRQRTLTEERELIEVARYQSNTGDSDGLSARRTPRGARDLDLVAFKSSIHCSRSGRHLRADVARTAWARPRGLLFNDIA
jgi:hypothetical protein